MPFPSKFDMTMSLKKKNLFKLYSLEYVKKRDRKGIKLSTSDLGSLKLNNLYIHFQEPLIIIQLLKHWIIYLYEDPP